jgi:2-polyprenyl-3-methyl-5-hydroxy-6-metoxy-1,4-benzoquinol methylase
MKTLEESIAVAMDMQDTAIVPFLQYILQDFWDLGTPPEIVINIVQKHCDASFVAPMPRVEPLKPIAPLQCVAPLQKHNTPLQILDLGCGKGATSVKLAKTLNCNCLGIDGISEFIEIAKEKAQEYKVEKLCRFETGDIREKIKVLGKFDVIVLGAIGQVFGDYYATLTTLSEHLAPDGIIIINDAYIEDSSTFQHPAILPRRELLAQTEQAEMELIDDYTDVASGEEYTEQFESIQKRCNELIAKYPEKKSLFENYIQIQADEYDMFENDIICSIMVFKRKQ